MQFLQRAIHFYISAVMLFRLHRRNVDLQSTNDGLHAHAVIPLNIWTYVMCKMRWLRDELEAALMHLHSDQSAALS